MRNKINRVIDYHDVPVGLVLIGLLFVLGARCFLYLVGYVLGDGPDSYSTWGFGARVYCHDGGWYLMCVFSICAATAVNVAAGGATSVSTSPPEWLTNILPTLITATVSSIGIIVQLCLSRRSELKARDRQREEMHKEAYLTFYEPLRGVLKPLVAYLQNDEASMVDLAAYDPNAGACRRKLKVTATYCNYIESTLKSSKSPLTATNAEMAQAMGTLREWVIGVLCLSKEKALPRGMVIPSDAEALSSMKALIRLIDEDETQINWDS